MINGGQYDSRWLAEWKLIYSVIVAGKSAKFTDAVMARLIFDGKPRRYPFDQIRNRITSSSLPEWLRTSRTGAYGRLEKCFPDLVKLNPETCSIDELEAIHGIGFKTSRFFMLWTRPGVRYAALDTHLMKFLRRLGHTKNRATPGAVGAYRRLEKIFLDLCTNIGRSPRELDFAVWESYRDGEEDALGSVPMKNTVIYQRIDWECERSLGMDSSAAGREKKTIVYNLTGAYITELDIKIAVRRFGRVKLVELYPEGEGVPKE